MTHIMDSMKYSTGHLMRSIEEDISSYNNHLQAMILIDFLDTIGVKSASRKKLDDFESNYMQHMSSVLDQITAIDSNLE